MTLKSAMLAFCLWQLGSCRPMGGEDFTTSLSSIRSGDDALKIAVNYIGESNCREQYQDDRARAAEAIAANNKVSNLITHLLNGKNGELISEEFKAVKKNSGHSGWQTLKFSGDKFFAARTADGKLLTMEHIQANCRRLVLSVDSDTSPTIYFAQGFAQKHQLDGFEKIALQEFGAITCLGDQPFCTFKNINGGKRYFALIWPDKTSNKVSATVNWTSGNKQDSATITIPNLDFEGSAPQAWTSSTEPETPTLTQLQAMLPSAFTAADQNGGGGKGMRPKRREVFATLTVMEATLEDENSAKITLLIKAEKKINSGTLMITAPQGSNFIGHSNNLTTTYTKSTGRHGAHTTTMKHPAGKYGFKEIPANKTASITFTAPLEKTAGSSSHAISFAANITRIGFWGSNTKDFEDDKKFNKIVIIFADDT